MKTKYLLVLAVLLVLACSALTAHAAGVDLSALLTHETLTLIAPAPLAATLEDEIKAQLERINSEVVDFKAKHLKEVERVSEGLDDVNTRIAAWQMNGGVPTGGDPAADNLDGSGIKVLRTAADFNAHYAGKAKAHRDATGAAAPNITLHEFVRGVAGMKTTEAVMASLSTGTDSAGGYAVPNVVMPGILSALVPASATLQAGAGIVPMEDGAKSVTTAAIDTIPTAAWRLELGNVAESDPTFRPVTAIPRSLACIVRFSRELAADGDDVDRALRFAIAQAFAKELDRVGLMGSGTAPEPRGLRNTPGISIVSMGANGSALANYRSMLGAYGATIAANAPAPTAAIMSGRTLLDYEGLVDTTGQPLRRPRLLESMNFLPTSQIPVNMTEGTSNDTSEIYVGNFSGMYYLMRESLSIQMLRETYAKTGELGFLCHMRADVVINYPQQFAVIRGVKPAVAG